MSRDPPIGLALALERLNALEDRRWPILAWLRFVLSLGAFIGLANGYAWLGAILSGGVAVLCAIELARAP